VPLFAVFVAIRVVVKGESKSEEKYTRLILLICIGFFILLSLYFYTFTVDDVYISLTYAKNFARGHGLVHSVDGELVEGYTNFLWVLLESVFLFIGVPEDAVIHCIKIIGLIFGIGIIVLTSKMAELIQADAYARLLAPLFLAATPYFAFWAVGGLETPMYIFLLISGLYRYGLELKEDKPHLISMVLFLLMALTRPEGFILGLVVIIWEVFGLLRTRGDRAKGNSAYGLRQLVPGVLIFLGLYTIYFIWRYQYYGYLLPNTFYAKAGPPGIIHLLRRLNRMKEFIVYLLPLAAMGTYSYAITRSVIPRFKRLLGVIVVVLVLLSFVSKGEWMPGFRYELPILPIVSIFFAYGISLLISGTRQLSGELRRLYAGAAGLLFLITVYILSPAPQLSTYRLYGTALNKAHIALGKWIDKHMPKDGSLAAWDMGALPYYSNLPVIHEIHPVGLLSASTTHNGYDPDHILSLEPSIIVLPPRPEHMPKDFERNPNYQILTFYTKKKFMENYDHVFSFAFAVDYVLDVYKRSDIPISQRALKEGWALGEHSLRWARGLAAIWNIQKA